jgi:hypothetical protein
MMVHCHGRGRLTKLLRESSGSGTAGLNNSDGCRPPQPEFVLNQIRKSCDLGICRSLAEIQEGCVNRLFLDLTIRVT